jgi:parallel beta-helix repeat protein
LRKAVSGIMLMLLLVGMWTLAFRIPSVKAATIIVPDGFPTIQAAVDNASDGDTVFVRAGTYYEHVVVNKTVALVGENRDTTIVDGSRVGIVVNVTRDSVSISGFTIRNCGTAWNIGGPPYSAGVYMRNVTSSSISGNVFIQDAVAIQLEYGADGNIIANNTMTGVTLGFGTFDASWNSFISNNVSSNGRGLGLNVNSDYNVISDNRITSPEWVVGLHICHYNNITRNYIANGQIGIYLPDSSDNRLYHNTIVNNLLQASTTYGGFSSLHNYWDNSYLSGGNYWSDYTGLDLHKGPYQNETGSDGIGDASYVIDANNTDRYPLMKPYPWGPHDAGVTYIGKCYEIGTGILIYPPRTVAGLNILLHLDVFVMNYGDHTEVLNLTIFANNTIVSQVSNVTLAAKNSTILDVHWDTSGFEMGNYTISAYLESVPGESDVKDNNYTDGRIIITIPGDLNGDFRVSLADLIILARCYSSRPGDPNWNPNADVEGNDAVGLSDLVILARHYGQHYL